MANWKTIFLVGSLGLNLIGIGGIIGAKWRHGGFGHHSHGAHGFGDPSKRIARITKNLNEEKRADVTKMLTEYLQVKKQNFKTMGEAGQRIRTIMNTDPFDEKALEEAHAGMIAIRKEQMDRRFEIAKKLGRILDKDERHQLLRLLGTRRHGRRFGRRFRHGARKNHHGTHDEKHHKKP